MSAAKGHYLLGVLGLWVAAWSALHFGDANLPPLLMPVRWVILAVYANLAAGYVWFLNSKALPEENPQRWWPLALCGLIVAGMFPLFSGDLMEYLIRGRMLAVYHLSPYVHLPSEIPNDLLSPFCVWKNNPDSYGPLSVYFQTIPALLFRDSIAGMIWGYKALMVGVAAVSVVFFWKILGLAGYQERGKLWAMFAYSPLLIVSAWVDGHNDVLMMMFSILSFYFLMQKRWTWAFTCVTFAFLVKYTVLLQLPIFVVVAVREEWKRSGKFPLRHVVLQPLLQLAIIAACFAPVWGGVDTFLALIRASKWFYSGTMPYAFQQAMALIGVALPEQAIKIGFLSVYAVLYVYWLKKTWDIGLEKPQDLFRIVCLAYLAFYVTVTIPFGFWYLLWAFPWLVLSRWPAAHWLVTLYAFAGLLSFFKRINYLFCIAIVIYVIVVGIRGRIHGHRFSAGV